MRKVTDYGMVVMAHFARGSGAGIQTTRSISEATGIPQPTVAKVLKTLANAGLLQSYRGLCGGYGLVHEPARVAVVDIIEAFEGPLSLTECSHTADVTCIEADHCGLARRWPSINTAVRAALLDVTLADLVTPSARPFDADADADAALGAP